MQVVYIDSPKDTATMALRFAARADAIVIRADQLSVTEYVNLLNACAQDISGVGSVMPGRDYVAVFRGWVSLSRSSQEYFHTDGNYATHSFGTKLTSFLCENENGRLTVHVLDWNKANFRSAYHQHHTPLHDALEVTTGHSVLITNDNWFPHQLNLRHYLVPGAKNETYVACLGNLDTDIVPNEPGVVTLTLGVK